MIGLEDERTKDMCPICKTDKYLSPNMTFLINPECYHKICESCVDRIFSLGPAPCPYPKCGKILRKNKFKKQIFDDILIEREIDIRKRISNIFNKTEEDFPSLDEYNQYLEKVENVIFNLNNGVDKEKTEEEVNKYEAENKIEILEKSMRESQKNSDFTKYQEAVERLKQEKLRIQKQMEIEDIQYQKQQQQELLDKLSSSNTANSDEIIKQQQSNMQKRSQFRKRQLQQLTSQLDQNFSKNNPLTKKEVDNEPKAPFTPFQGDRELKKRYELLPIPRDVDDLLDIDNHADETYQDPYVNKLAKNKEYLGAGWRLHTVFERALDEAFMGLGCFIEKEKMVS
ncbi:RNA polymerase II transcription factor B subunit 3 [Suhomyces tanzawaensis NRRL Y-17324]|uniref:RNA polymerase II transcription factor B subunit 3 n=1 Tax=Suhomyces tanzawaensis NRRL Y-17324 TaxID=984487 RepID=A0A1E4SQE0_9ASCO|nr:RNA polymerase II transcription factor B subunit 3 [Suhomyces tanzawaensis NRRL Y-17324]ODV81657.1 RNA polymerase II transcription factor B subunit 3 [Suhomyces tanzawaensis NRRL Y-17324]